MKNTIITWAGIALLQVGCTLAPKYSRPISPVPEQWPAGAAYDAAPGDTNAPQARYLNWQEFFTDEKLQQLVALALTNNRNLRVAMLNVERAQAIYGVQRAELLPVVNAAGSGSIADVPADLSSSGERTTSERYDVNLGVASWEVDLFGRIRSLKDRALEEYLATEQARCGAQILLISSVANAYLTLAADQENLALAQTTLEAQEKAKHLIGRRYELGLCPELDLHRVETQVETARGDMARFTQRVALDVNALTLLTGAPIPEELLPFALAPLPAPQALAVEISSDVLLQRPDVLQAESALKAANADIGAARAMLFPRISLTTAFGTASSRLSGLFEAGSDTWSFAPRVSIPIFDSRSWSALKASKIQREMAVAQYEKAIQTAFREVADTLAVRGTVDQQVAAQEALVNAVSATYRLSVVRYEQGIDNYLSVLDAQRSLYAAQQGLVSLRLAKLTNQTQLYAVLGGGGY